MTQLNALMLVRSLDTIIESLSISVNTTYTLPSTARKGQSYLIFNSTSNSSILTIQTSDPDTIDTIQTGCSLLTALQDNPTDLSHWKLVYSYEEGTFTPVQNIVGGNGTSTWVTGTDGNRFRRINKLITFHIGGTYTKGDRTNQSVRIGGLPYDNYGSPNVQISLNITAITIPAQRQITANVANGTGRIIEMLFIGGGTQVGITSDAFAASTSINLSGSYLIP